MAAGIGLDARKPRRPSDFRKLIDSGSFLGVQALKAIDHDLARQLAGILARQRASVQDTTLIVRVNVP